MAIKSMEVLYLGSDHADESRITYGVAPGTMVEAVFLSFLIRADEGNILVDTGIHPEDAEKENAEGLQRSVQPEDHLPLRLKEIGLSMEDINILVMTHLDRDHIGWLNQLPRAEVVVQKEEYHFAFDPPPYARHRYRFPERFKSPEIKWKLVDGDHILIPGLTVLFTPGHTPGHQSLVVNLPKNGKIILAGDVVHFVKNFEKELIPSFCGDPKQALYSIRRLKVLSQVMKAPLFPTHDMDLWRRDMLKPPKAYT
ncbi:N-acyl homoserine lactonase family protein [Chloroflexota bacterium]